MDIATAHNSRAPQPFQSDDVAPEDQAQHAAGKRVLDFVKGTTTVQQLQALQYLYGGGAPSDFAGFAGFFDTVRHDLNQANRAFIKGKVISKGLEMFFAACKDDEFKIEMREAITARLPPYLAVRIQQAAAEANRIAEEAAQQEETPAPGFATTLAGEPAAAPDTGAAHGLSIPLTLIGRLLEEIALDSGASVTSASTAAYSTFGAQSRVPPSE